MKKLMEYVKKTGMFVSLMTLTLTMMTTAMPVHAAARKDTNKKGILLASSMAGNTAVLHELGVTQITYNLPLSILTKNGTYPYKYKGTTYYFNAGTINGYDSLMTRMHAAGISVTMIVLNDWNGGDTALIHPLSRGYSGANYYAFNTADQAGINKLEAIAHFLADRYSGKMGVIDNWIIGNEANARQEWNYMSSSAGLTVCAQEYGKALRIFYNAVTSHNPQARVYASLDHEWSAVDNPSAHYSGKDFLNAMQAYITGTSNFDFGIAIHPYNVPLYKADTWNVGAYATHSVDSPYISSC